MSKLVIIKIGGNVIDDEESLLPFLDHFASLDYKKILVHGGGRLATTIANRLGLEQKMVEGRRITDAETLKVVTMVYAGYINKNLVSQLQARQCNAIGVSGADGNLLPAQKRSGSEIDFGFAGDIRSTDIDAGRWRQLIENGLIPVVCPITHNGKGQLLNTNADTIAQELAKAMSSLFEVSLVYCFERPGVLTDPADDATVMPNLDKLKYAEMKSLNQVFAGMIPKLDNAFSALEAGVRTVVIGHAQQLPLLVEGRAGTTITDEPSKA